MCCPSSEPDPFPSLRPWRSAYNNYSVLKYPINENSRRHTHDRRMWLWRWLDTRPSLKNPESDYVHPIWLLLILQGRNIALLSGHLRHSHSPRLQRGGEGECVDTAGVYCPPQGTHQPNHYGRPWHGSGNLQGVSARTKIFSWAR